jgi:acetyl-CoA carboxylase carboxyltransferase component
MRKLLGLVFDRDSLFEIGQYQGPSEITMLGRLHGYPVGILANDPEVMGGIMTEGACEKMIRFIDMCDTFHIPIVNFVDQPGVAIGLQAESRGTIRKAIRLQTAIFQANVPWATFFVRRSFGVAGGAYEPRIKATIRHAWPSGWWGSIPVEGGVEAAYKREIMNAEDPKARRDELVKHYQKLESPFRTAERFNMENIIDPRETRPILCEWIEEAYEEIPLQLGIVTKTIRC